LRTRTRHERRELQTHYYEFRFSFTVAIILTLIAEISSNSDASARSLDLSVPSWRPLAQNPYQHPQFYQNAAPALISFANYEQANKEDIAEVAKHNAQLIRKYKEINHHQQHQPITSYSNPYPLYTQTPGPLASNAISTTGFFNPQFMRQPQIAAAASSLVQNRMPYPSKGMPSLYQTKLNYLGNQNSIHQTLGTTPKIAGYTKESNGQFHLHYHHPSPYGISPMSTTTKRNPKFR